MASTELRRKARKNRVVSKLRQDNIKRLTRKPVLKLVDIEKIKEEFAAKAASKKKTASEKVEKEPVKKAEAKAAVKEKVAEKKVVKNGPKKSTASAGVKKTAPKTKKETPDKKKEDKA
jgi:hypothetical protein